MTELLARLYAAFDTGDAIAWTEALAPDVVMIGTDATEWWSGKDVAATVLRAQSDEMHDAGILLTGLIRQGHLSVGAPNEEVVQQTLTV